MNIAAFLSHPIQHFSPLWREIVALGGHRLKVFYYSRHGLDAANDPGFDRVVKWDVDLLEGYESEFLPRAWPTRDPLDCTGKALNRGMARALHGGWDVAYVSGYAHLNNWAVARLCGRFGIPLLYQSDSNLLAERKRPAWRRWLKRWVLRPFFRRVTVFLACGDHNRDYLLYYGAPADRVCSSAIPVDTQRFREATSGLDATTRASLRREYGLEPEDFVAGFCGKLISRKRPQDLLQAVELAGGPRLRAFYIGTGQMREQLEAHGGPARFAGFVNQAQMPRVLSLCDVLVMPSARDPHPIIVTEAQCLGIPVILSDQCGCYGPNDVFRDGESGILYPCSDTTALAEAIKVLYRNPERRHEMGARARELAQAQSAVTTAQKFVEAAAKATQLAAVADR